MCVCERRGVVRMLTCSRMFVGEREKKNRERECVCVCVAERESVCAVGGPGGGCSSFSAPSLGGAIFAKSLTMTSREYL
jgi:hypothetical protein